jgi:WD40 repeat protein
MSDIRVRWWLKGPLRNVLLAVVVVAAVIGLVMLGDLGLKIGSGIAAVAATIPIVSSYVPKLKGLLGGTGEPRVAGRPSEAITAPLPAGLPATDDLNDRPEYTAVLGELSAAAPITALVGPGGFGKTALAALACSDPETRRLFPGGIRWIPVGRHAGEAELSEIARQAQAEATHDVQRPQPEPAGESGGRARLMLALDDVRTRAQLAAFLLQDAPWQLLVTTREPGVLPDAVRPILVGPMTPVTADALLAHDLPGLAWERRRELRELAGGCALVLRLVRILLHRKDAGEPNATAARIAASLRAKGLTALEEANSDGLDLAQAAPVNHGIDAIDPPHRDRFAELGVFPPEVRIPLPVVMRLWHATSGLSPADAQALAARLEALKLISLPDSGDEPVLVLDDIIRAVAAVRLGDRARAAQTALLGGARDLVPTPAGPGETAWWALPDTEDYWWQYLTFHLKEAGCAKELNRTCGDLRFIIRKLQHSGPAGLAGDLGRADSPAAHRLRDAVLRNARLLAPADPPAAYAGVVTSRLGDMDDVAGQLETVRKDLHAWTCRPVWPLPSGPSAELDADFLSVDALAVSPDGTWLASGGWGGTIRIWGADGDERAVLSADDGLARIRSLAISPDGTWLIACGTGGGVRTWGSDGSERRMLPNSLTGASAVAISPDGTWLATGHRDGTVRRWGRDGTDRGTLPGNGARATDIAISPAGDWLAVAHDDGTVRLLRTDGKVRATLTSHRNGVTALAISPDGKWLVTGDEEGLLRIWSGKGRRRHSHTIRAGWLGSAAISSDGTWMVTGHSDGVRFWAADGSYRGMLRGFGGAVHKVAMDQAGTWLAAGCDDGKVLIWPASIDEAGPAELAVSGALSVSVHDVAISGDGTWLVVGDGNGAVRRRGADGNASRYLMQGLPTQPVAISPDGTWVATGSVDGSVWKLDAHDGTVQVRMLGQPDDGTGVEVNSVAISPDGSWLASYHRGGTVRIWGTDGTERHRFPGLVGYVRGMHALAVSPDGKWLAVGGDDGVRMWGTDGSERAALTDPLRGVHVVAISPDGRWLAAGGDAGVQIWNVDGSRRCEPVDAIRQVYAVAISPDGTHLAVGSSDGAVRILDSGGVSITELRTDDHVYGCAWFPAAAAVDLCVAGQRGVYRFALQQAS